MGDKKPEINLVKEILEEMTKVEDLMLEEIKHHSNRMDRISIVGVVNTLLIIGFILYNVLF